MYRLTALLILLVTHAASAQTEIVGDWSGDIDVSVVQPGAGSLTAIFHISQGEDGLVATFDSPDQGAFGIPLSDVVFDGETFSASLAAASAQFEGIFDPESNEIRGSWTQGGREMPLSLSPYEPPVRQPPSRTVKPLEIKPGDFSGIWTGVIALGNGGEMHITFRLARNEDGSYNAVLDAPGQAENMDLGEIDVFGNEVAIDIMGQASFAGTISDDELSMEGTFEQGGSKQPISMVRQ